MWHTVRMGKIGRGAAKAAYFTFGLTVFVGGMLGILLLNQPNGFGW